MGHPRHGGEQGRVRCRGESPCCLLEEDLWSAEGAEVWGSPPGLFPEARGTWVSFHPGPEHLEAQQRAHGSRTASQANPATWHD